MIQVELGSYFVPPSPAVTSYSKTVRTLSTGYTVTNLQDSVWKGLKRYILIAQALLITSGLLMTSEGLDLVSDTDSCAVIGVHATVVCLLQLCKVY